MLNKLIIFTGPSGVGKATIEKKLFENKDLSLEFSISATTRAPRNNEKEGKEYYFISHDEFNKRIENSEFIEWNEHFDNKYGTLRQEINRIKKENKIPFIEVETNGAKNLMKSLEKNEYISIFIEPPSIKELEKRIRLRSTETEEQIIKRIKRAYEEIKDKNYFNFSVVNDNIEECAKKVADIIRRSNEL